MSILSNKWNTIIILTFRAAYSRKQSWVENIHFSLFVPILIFFILVTFIKGVCCGFGYRFRGDDSTHFGLFLKLYLNR